MPDIIDGSCLCGDIEFSVEDQFSEFHFCHCSQCQKISGSAFVANIFTSPSNITWLKVEALVERYDDPERDFSRAFCRRCGCGLPFVTKSGRALIVPAGCLNKTPTRPVDDNIFWDERAHWHDAGLKSKKFAGFPD